MAAQARTRVATQITVTRVQVKDAYIQVAAAVPTMMPEWPLRLLLSYWLSCVRQLFDYLKKDLSNMN
jgi:hypothetical protein